MYIVSGISLIETVILVITPLGLGILISKVALLYDLDTKFKYGSPGGVS